MELGSRALAVSVAHRAAMRVAPLDWCETHPIADSKVSALRSLKLLLISCVACHVERQAIKQATVMAIGGMDFTAAEAARAAWTAVLACDTAPAIAPGTAVQAVSLAAEALGAGPTIQARHDGSVSHDGRSTYGSDLSKRELIWSLARRDVGTSSGQDTGTSSWGRRLWFDDRGPLADLWTGIRDAWSAAGAGWQFWIDWYEAALNGRPLLGDWDRHWDLLTELILTAGIDWNAPPERVNGLIAEIVARRSGQRMPVDDAADALRRNASPPESVISVQRAMDANRHTLPQTLDGIEALILLEIERLQKDNYLNVTVPEECRRQIGNYLAMYEAVRALKARVPLEAPTTHEAAAESERLVKFYWKKFKALSRAKADSVVEGVWQTGAGVVQLGLILASTSLAVSYGVPAFAAITTGALLIAPQRAGEIIRAAKDVLAKP